MGCWKYLLFCRALYNTLGKVKKFLLQKIILKENKCCICDGTVDVNKEKEKKSPFIILNHLFRKRETTNNQTINQSTEYFMNILVKM